MSPEKGGSPTLILASTSAYRRALLGRLDVPSECIAPDIDETRLSTEEPEDMVTRLAKSKAAAVAAASADALVIGSDQVAVLQGDVLGKPLEHEVAVAQLRRASGQRVEFLTAVCVLHTRRREVLHHTDRTAVSFRRLTNRQIENYLRREQPYDCAGSFKCEGLGIALFEAIESTDPTALQGLPLIWLVQALQRFGLDVI